MAECWLHTLFIDDAMICRYLLPLRAATPVSSRHAMMLMLPLHTPLMPPSLLLDAITFDVTVFSLRHLR